MARTHEKYLDLPPLDLDIQIEVHYLAREGCPASYFEPADPHEFEIQEVLFLSQYGWAPYSATEQDLEWIEEKLNEEHDFSEPDYGDLS